MVRIPGFRPQPRRTVLHSGEVRGTEQLTPHLVRIVIGGPGLNSFTPNGFTDAYVKVVFPRAGVSYPEPFDLDRIREQQPREEWPQQRTYTVRAWDAATRELTIDFVVHGDEGLAGPWARAARTGDPVHLLGPGGGYAPDPAADWHLLAGDESALPAIAAALERMPGDARGAAVIEVPSAEDEQKLTVPAGVELRWLARGDAPVGRPLVDAVRALDLPSGRVQAFVHGEAGFVRDLRRHLRVERALDPAELSISGYWRLGADDEGWRSIKRQWNQEIEDAEAAAGLH